MSYFNFVISGVYAPKDTGWRAITESSWYVVRDNLKHLQSHVRPNQLETLREYFEDSLTFTLNSAIESRPNFLSYSSYRHQAQ